jgi:phage terminase small subunit
MSLNPRQKRFVEEYILDLNAKQAAIRAGYSPHTAEVQGSRLLSHIKVQEAIHAAKEKRSKDYGVTAGRVVQELAAIGFSDAGDVLDFTGEQPRLRPANQIPEGARRAISSIKVKRHIEGTGDAAREVEVIEYKFWDKNSALDKLGKHTGVLTDKLAINGEFILRVVEEIVDARGDKDNAAASGASGVSGE